ncbi:hypothetical protein [Streptomyces sp. FH025]|uniref:hypothetical protein n=1 Tax=Streptomyces sp. FH025 TaxID=2815937 RepID=UPI0035AFC98E
MSTARTGAASGPRCPEVDITALDAAEALRRELTGRGVVFGMARDKQDLLEDLESYGPESIGPELIFPTLPTALDAYRAWCTAHDGGPDVS